MRLELADRPSDRQAVGTAPRRRYAARAVSGNGRYR